MTAEASTTKFLDIPTVARALERSEMTVRRLVKRGEIGYLRIGQGRGRIMFLQRHLDEYMARCERTIPAEGRASAHGA